MAAVPLNLGVPTGTVMWSAAQEPPVGWLLCDGRLVSIADYPALYEFIGTVFGGDGNLNFGLPDLVGRFIVGVGDAGRERFTYEDGINEEHVHGMFPEKTHTHGVTDPGHEHPTSSGSHKHNCTSTHNHPMTSDHDHYMANLRSSSYILASTCAREAYAPKDGSGGCEPSPEDNFPAATNFKETGITGTRVAFTGASLQIAFTNVTLQTQLTGITLRPSLSNMTVDRFGVTGGPRPDNIALLPIIRT